MKSPPTATAATHARGGERLERVLRDVPAPNGIGDITFNRRVELSRLRRNAAIHFVELRLDRLKDATQRARHAIGSGG